MKALYVFVIAAFFLNFANAENEIISYDNEYKGIKVGLSTLADVVDVFGSPMNKKLYDKRVKYYYSDFHVSVSDKTGRIKGIVIFDKSYKDKNGIKIGFNKEYVNNKIKYKFLYKKTTSDLDKGIIYHFDNEKVKAITLAHEFAVKDAYKKDWEKILQEKKSMSNK